MKDEKEVKQALKDSIKYFKKLYPNINPKQPMVSFDESLGKGLKQLAIANEICTLKWVLGKGKLNCYGEENDNK